MGDGIRADQITPRTNSGESSLCGSGEKVYKLASVQFLGSEPEHVLLADWYFTRPKSSSCVGESGTPLVSHLSQTHGPFLPCRQKFQEAAEMLGTIPIDNEVDHPCGQARKDGL